VAGAIASLSARSSAAGTRRGRARYCVMSGAAWGATAAADADMAAADVVADADLAAADAADAAAGADEKSAGKTRASMVNDARAPCESSQRGRTSWEGMCVVVGGWRMDG
jgi:hypothetical protein